MDFLLLIDAFLFGVGAIGLFFVFTSNRSRQGKVVLLIGAVMAAVAAFAGFPLSQMAADWWPTNAPISLVQQLIEAVLYLAILFAAVIAIHAQTLRKSINALTCCAAAIVAWMVLCRAYTLVAITVLLMSFVYLFFQKRIGEHGNNEISDDGTDESEHQSSPQILWACVAGILFATCLSSVVQRTVVSQSPPTRAWKQAMTDRIQAIHTEEEISPNDTSSQSGQALLLTPGGSGLMMTAWTGTSTIGNR